LTRDGFPSIHIKPFPIGQGEPLPDATQAHLAPLWLISQEGQLMGFGTVLFLVSNTGADILISNNILDFLGILRYRPPIGYENTLMTEAKRRYIPLEKRAPPWEIYPEVLNRMIHHGQCLLTESDTIEGIALAPFELTMDKIQLQEAARDGRLQRKGGRPLPEFISAAVNQQVEDLVDQGAIVRIIPECDPCKTKSSCVTFSLNHCKKCRRNRERCLCDEPDLTDSHQAVEMNDCAVTEQFESDKASGCQIASKQSEPGGEFNPGRPQASATPKPQPEISKQEIRKQKIQEANDLKIGKEPPLKKEIVDALHLLKRIAESSPEEICTREEIDDLQKELAKGRPEWAKCLTPAHTQKTPAEAQWASKQIEDMMDGRFKDTVFGKTLSTPCSFKPFEIKVKPGSAPEKSIQPRRFKDPKITQLIEDWVAGLLKDNLIQESQTPVAAPVTVVLKKGREPRVCIDYRERNARTDTPVYPMPDIHDFLDEAAGYAYYCSFDCAKMFNQYEIVKEHRYLAAFMTQSGTYEPSRIMFGVTGGPQHAVRSARPALKEHAKTNGTAFTAWAILQNEQGETPPYFIDEKIGIVPGSRLDIFIDDCRIPQNKLKGMVKLCELWFEFCEEHHLVLSRKKAKLCLTHLPFLGFVVSSEGKHLDPNRISSLLDHAIPTSREGLHALLCSYNFVRMFILDFSVIASPLYAATKGIIWKGPGSGRSKGTREVDPNFKWNETLDRALRQLQTSLMSAPILACPDYSKALFLSVDACLKGEGWVLWQIVEGRNGSQVPIALHYGSTKYEDSESTWEVTRQEAHAIQSALKDVYDYIFSCHFYLLTDHRNLTFLSNSVNRAVIRIRHFMQQFNMTVVHVPGAWNNPADGISRLDLGDLPVRVASNLMASTTTQALDEFATVTRGTSTDGDHQEEGDRIVRVGKNHASVFFTTGNSEQSGCSYPNCLLCEPTLVEEQEDEEKAQCFFSSQQNMPGLIDDDGDSECSEDDQGDWERNWDLVEHVCLKGSGSKVLLTRAQARKQAEEWNSRTPIKTEPVPPSGKERTQEDEEWIPQMKESRSSKILSVSKEWISISADNKETESETVARECGLCSETQTTPADFRAVHVQCPFTKEFQSVHNDEDGHHGIDHSYRKLLVKYKSGWAEERGTATEVRNHLKTFIKNCPTCQKIKGLQDKVKSKHSFIVSRPFIEVSYDFICFEKPDRNGNRYILVVVDNFTKLVELKAVPDRGAEGVARFLLELKARYGPINRLRSDREKAFTSQIVSKLNELTGTTTLPCIVYHPEANSVCERQNQLIMIHLRALVLGAKLGVDSAYVWSDLIPFVYSIVNNTPKLPLAVSPLSMVYGIFANYDQPLLPPHAPESHSNPVDYVDGLVDWQNKLLELAEGIQSKYLEKIVLANAAKNEGSMPRVFNEGDFILQVKNSTGARGKLLPRWLGPKLVLSRQNNDPSHSVLELFDLVSSKITQASIDDCRIFHTGWFDEPTMLQDLNRLAALDKEEYEVETILEHRPPGPQRKLGVKPSDYWFKVKWAGFSDEENSWEPYSELKDLLPLEEYLTQYPELKL
jgi:hypothetical protein